MEAASMVARGAVSSVALDSSVRRWLERSCAAQGLPVVVTDASVLAKVVTLLGGPGFGRASNVRAVA